MKESLTRFLQDSAWGNNMDFRHDFDAIVIGAGHAGAEAALALARLGNRTLNFCLNLDSVGFLACNPSIGGTAKGHLVCEIDALGGQMGINADKTAIQMRMLNRGKGPAVYSLRAQTDKVEYHKEMKATIENQENLTLRQGEVTDILYDGEKIVGVKTKKGQEFTAKVVVVCTGVYLKSKIIIGEFHQESGPNGFVRSNTLTESLQKLGFQMKRLKTGTPARVDGRTIHYSGLEVQYGDDDIQTFSFVTKDKPQNKVPCYLTYTTQRTHEIIRENLHRAPMFTGVIEGVGPRYCPSIEDKIVRFADKDRHQVFLEPESISTNEVYVQGVSTSLPVDVQEKLYSSITGLENVQIMRDAYAIEYDAIDATELKATLESKRIKGLFFAGQVNGTSGYEEAAAQGLIAGINADCVLKNKKPFILKRNQGYIGVLIDDLITKELTEPYRMMTSRAEYRLVLRQDNADLRLTQLGRECGLVDDERYEIYKQKLADLEKAEELLKTKFKIDEKFIQLFTEKGENIPDKSMSAKEMIKRNNITAFDLNKVYGLFQDYSPFMLELINTQVKYEGYIRQQNDEIEKSIKADELEIPEDFEYKNLKGLRLEARQKLDKIRPYNISQAKRILGVSPADISVLIIMVKAFIKDKHKKNKETM